MAATATTASLDHAYYSSKMDKPVTLETNVKELLKQTEHQQQKLQQHSSQDSFPDSVMTFSQVLASIGYMGINDDVYHKLRSIYPVVNVSDLHTNVDWNLANLYKCDVYHHGCYFTTSNEVAFKEHLSSEHSSLSLFCFYCTKSGHDDSCHNVADHSQFSQPEQLVEHIKSQHKDIKFQCNLCFYRAFSADHIFIHQATEHLTNFEQTLKRALLDKDDELSPFEREFIQQATDNDDDDDTEVEDNDNDECGTVSSNQLSINELCKIIVCGPVDNDSQNVLISEYFQKHAVDLEKYSKTSLVSCAYCPTELRNASDEIDDFWVHSVSSHPDFPILAYDLTLAEKLSNSLDLSLKSQKKKYTLGSDFDGITDPDEWTERIVTNFREQLALNSLSQSYEDTLINNAFEYYESLDKVQLSSKGVKRKFENMTDERADVTKEPKRQRLFDRFTISDSMLQKTKKVASIVVTAAMAFGFYQLTHFLPDSVQTYLN